MPGLTEKEKCTLPIGSGKITLQKTMGQLNYFWNIIIFGKVAVCLREAVSFFPKG